MKDWEVAELIEGVEVVRTVSADDLATATEMALSSGEKVLRVQLVEPTEFAPTADPTVVQAPNGTLYRLTVTNAGTVRAVKITTQ